MQQILTVGIGGCFGALARYAVNGLMLFCFQNRLSRYYPAGTLLVNVIGCLAIGVLMEWVTQKTLSEGARLFLITGFLGSLTTFSTFGYETVALIRENDMRLAFWNVAANLCVGLLAVWAGMACGRWSCS